MRKVVDLLDEGQCRTMLWFVDLGLAVFSSALIVVVLKTVLGSAAVT
jgi:hypothetical protein